MQRCSLVFSVSGDQAFYTEVVQEFESGRREFPGQEFAYLGSPFEEELPHPLADDKGRWELSPFPLLFKGWRRVSVFCEEKLYPALAAGKIAVVWKFGRDVAERAALACTSSADMQRLLRVHDSIVTELAELGILCPPYYLMEEPCPHRLARDTGSDRENVATFISRSELFHELYFHREGTKQHTPLVLPRRFSPSERKAAIREFCSVPLRLAA